MKYFIITSTFKIPFEKFGDTVAEHRIFLQGGYDKNWILCSGPQSPKVGGAIIARAPSLEDIRNFFANDPYQKKGLAEYCFIEFEPVKRQALLETWATGQ